MSLDEPSTGNATRPVERLTGDERSDDDVSTQPMRDLPLFAEPEVSGDRGSKESEGREESEPSGGAGATQEPAPASYEPSATRRESRPAPLLGRLAASGFDLVAVAAALALLVGVSAAMGIAARLANLPFYLPTWLAFGFFYQVLPLLFWGQTPGMMLAGLESRDDQGEPLTLEQATLRWLGNLFTWLLLGLPGLLAVTGRSFTDRLSRSHTLVSS